MLLCQVVQDKICSEMFDSGAELYGGVYVVFFMHGLVDVFWWILSCIVFRSWCCSLAYLQWMQSCLSFAHLFFYSSFTHVLVGFSYFEIRSMYLL